ncbi:MAG: GNAT family N-acetyltransferase [Candidatus Gracilibacteria bacterium]|nr:GNAT family N-acetyltransferase [Candidatus Gracilibacteria bacterium]
MLKIRSLKNTDLVDCAEIILKAFKKAPYKEKWTKARVLRSLRHDSKGQIRLSLAALENKKLIGFAIVQLVPWDTADLYFVSTLAVKDSEQNKLIGTKLLVELEKRAKKRGIKSINLNANTKSKAFSFYQKNGFQATDWVNMVKKLGSRD